MRLPFVGSYWPECGALGQVLAGCLFSSSLLVVPALAGLLEAPRHLRHLFPVRYLCTGLVDWNWENSLIPMHAHHRSYPGAVRHFVEACEWAFAHLSQQQLAVLKPLLGKDLPRSAMHPASAEVQIAQRSAAREALHRRDAPFVTRAQLPKGASTASLRDLLSRRHKGTPMEWLEQLGLPGEDTSQIESIEPSEVAAAFQYGHVALFDGTKVLPGSVFNTSMEELDSLHRSTGSKVPFWTGKNKVCSMLCAAQWWCVGLELEAAICGHSLMNIPDKLVDAIVNVRRVPNFVDLDKQILPALGLDDWVQRTEGQLFWGYRDLPMPHWDEQDNIMFGIAGVSVVWVVPSNYTDAVNGLKTPAEPWTPDNIWLSEFVPYYKVALFPGDALVIPSRSYHWFRSSPDRVGLNCFLEPKFKHEGWPTSAPGGYWHRETKERRALRNLWTQSLAHLWDTRQQPMFLQGIIEYL